jgi:selenocysteine lyase/cysteine desulfurase
LLAGFSATIAYLESLGGMAMIASYERELGRRFLDRLADSVTVYGLQSMEGRVATFLLNVDGVPAADVAARLAARGFGVWANDNWYRSGCVRSCPTDRRLFSKIARALAVDLI